MNSIKINLTLNWTFLVLIFIDCASLASPKTSFSFQIRREKRHSQTFVNEKRHSSTFVEEKRHIPTFLREKRHTPFLPGDYWKDNRPDFGSTETTLSVMENSTAKFKCPITHVADSSVS